MVRSPTPLAVPLTVVPGTSLAGMNAASARLNVLGDVTSTMRAIGLTPNRPGSISMRMAGREEALAQRIGCSPEDVRLSSTPYVGSSDEGIIRWGNGELLRRHLETRYRRISPLSLQKAPHHRATWMNLLLDYCPESLERLVDTCPSCSRPLGWRAAWGIWHCDDPACCDVPAGDDHLPAEWANGYRMFAKLVSPTPEERSAFVTTLSPELQRLRPASLTSLTLGLGAALQGITSSGCDRFGKLEPIDRARCAATGAPLILNWPHSLRDAVTAQIGSPSGRTSAARRQLRSTLRLAAGLPRGDPDVSKLMKQAIPEIFVEVGRAFAGMDRPMVLGSVASRTLGTTHEKLSEAARAGIFEEVGVHSGEYRRVLYVAAEIDAAAAAWRSSAPIEVLARQTGLPRYACERIVAHGDVRRERHPYVLRFASTPRVVSASLDQYVRRVDEASSTSSCPANAVRVGSAMKMIGGRLKPWRQFFAAVLDGSLPCWINEGLGPLLPRMHVRASELMHFAALDADAGLPGDALFSDQMSQIDAMTVLNLRQVDGPSLIQEGLLQLTPGNRSLLVPVEDVLEVAKQYIGTAEVAARRNVSPATAYALLIQTFGPKSTSAGWHRAAVEEHFGHKL